MKRSIICSVSVCLCILVSLWLFGCANVEKSVEGEKRIAIVVKSVDSDFWHSVKEGVDSASTEYNVSVLFEGPANEEDYMTQNSMIEKAIQEKYDAIVFSAIDEEKSAKYVDSAVRNGLKVIAIDSGVNSQLVDMFIGTDNISAGAAAADAVTEHFDRDKAKGGKMKIGLVTCSAETENIKSRETGFREVIDKLPGAEIVAEVGVNNNKISATLGALDLLRKNPEINVLVGFNEWTTLGVGYAIESMEAGESVLGVGFDTNLVSVGMMETGEMDILIVQNPFAIGYLGVEYAARLISGEAVPEKEVYTDVTVVTRENLYDEEIQKMVFRFE